MTVRSPHPFNFSQTPQPSTLNSQLLQSASHQVGRVVYRLAASRFLKSRRLKRARRPLGLGLAASASRYQSHRAVGSTKINCLGQNLLLTATRANRLIIETNCGIHSVSVLLAQQRRIQTIRQPRPPPLRLRHPGAVPAPHPLTSRFTHHISVKIIWVCMSALGPEFRMYGIDSHCPA